MKTVIEELIEIVEMDFENGITISMRCFHSMLKKAKEKEKEQSSKHYQLGFDNAYDFILKNGMPDEILTQKH